MARLDIADAAPVMARALLAMVQVHRAAPPEIQWNIHQAMLLMIRNLERCVQHRVSIAAAEMAAKMGIPDLHTLVWRDQPKKMRDKDREIFHWEHVVQVSDIQKEVLSEPDPDLAKIEASLKKTFLAWILKEEDKLLPRGPRIDPFRLYAEKGIVFAPLPSGT
ncbi:hypothetical protein [Bradyrhizobium sp. STM 3562]|uniref:hypothetical protein n=1 Tax=Bradyrhizobium sp. STM 3562 TaxID=578924 RepID=UPI00388DE443